MTLNRYGWFNSPMSGGQFSPLVGIWEEEFDGLEAVVRSRLEAVEEFKLGVEHRVVGGESGHGASLILLPRAPN